MPTEKAFLTLLSAKIEYDELQLPTLPEIAVRVRDVVDDPDTSIQQVAQVIATDPSLSVLLIRVANSAYVKRQVPVDSIQGAVSRLGLTAVRNLAVSLALEKLFSSEQPIVDLYLRQVWRDSTEITAIAQAVFRGSSLQPAHLEIEVLSLAAMLHQVGALPILAEAACHEHSFANTRFLSQAIAQLSQTVAVKLIQSWMLGEVFEQVVQQWRKPGPGTEIGYADYIRYAVLLYKPELIVPEDTVQPTLQAYRDMGLDADQKLGAQGFEELVNSFRPEGV